MKNVQDVVGTGREGWRWKFDDGDENVQGVEEVGGKVLGDGWEGGGVLVTALAL